MIFLFLDPSIGGLKARILFAKMNQHHTLVEAERQFANAICVYCLNTPSVQPSVVFGGVHVPL